MIITINRQRVDWPKPTITLDQLRSYADADETYDIWQRNPLGGASLIQGPANIYDGASFYAIPKHGV